MKKLLGVLALAATLYTGSLFAHSWPPPDIWGDDPVEQTCVEYIVTWIPVLGTGISIPVITTVEVPCEN